MKFERELMAAAKQARCSIVLANENKVAFIDKGGGGHCFFRTDFGWLAAYRNASGDWSAVLRSGQPTNAPTIDALARQDVEMHPSAADAIRSTGPAAVKGQHSGRRFSVLFSRPSAHSI